MQRIPNQQGRGGQQFNYSDQTRTVNSIFEKHRFVNRLIFNQKKQNCNSRFVFYDLDTFIIKATVVFNTALHLDKRKR